MGCSATKKIIYNRYENPSNTENPNYLSGPFVRDTKQAFEDLCTLYQKKTYIEDVMKTFEENSEKPCLGWRMEIDDKLETDFTFMKYGEVKRLSEVLARNLIRMNLVSKDESTNHDFIGIFARNCAEWSMTDIACQLMSVTTVTFYSTLGELAFEHICKQTNISTICISPEAAQSLIDFKTKYGLERLRNVILYDRTQTIQGGAVESLIKAGLNVHSFNRLLIETDSSDIPFKISKPDTTLTICYTSGTTALPKGAEITQRNFISQMVNIEDSGYQIDNKSTHLSYLPMAHVMERICLLLCLFKGAKVGFISGDVRKYLREDINILKPTFLVAVPRVLDTFRKLIFDEISKMPAGCKKNLVEKALRVKRENLRNKGQITHGIYDRLLFNKIRAKFGGKIEVFITGAAPMSKDLADDIKILFCCPIIEAYGMTECTGGAVTTYFTDHTNTSAGGCLSTFKIKLIDVPEMKYSSKTLLNDLASPTGEICLYGPSVFKGYYKNPEETNKTIDSEGWLHTGDVGRILPYDQGLKIIDRVKEIFKLSQGEYIAPSKLESIYSKSKYVLQICVYGNSHKNNIVAILVPNAFNIQELVTSLGKWSENSKVEDFFDDKDVHDAIKKDLDELASINKFNSLEKIPKFFLTSQEFTIQNGCLTPTLKLIRRKVEEEFKSEIEKLYA